MFRGTYSSIEMLKWYMARESLGTPDLQYFGATNHTKQSFILYFKKGTLTLSNAFVQST